MRKRERERERLRELEKERERERERERKREKVYIYIYIYIYIYHHHHQVPDLEQTLAAIPLQTSLSSDNFKKFTPLLCPPVVPSYKDYQEMLFFVCPYRVCLLLFQLKIRISSLYVYTLVLKIPFASS